MNFSVRSLAAVVAFSLLCACGGGGGGSAVPASGGTSVQSGQASLQFFVPSTASSAAARRANALPSTTQSVQIIVTSNIGTTLPTPVGPFTFNVSATATGCSTVTGGIKCTESVTVPFGASVLFLVIAYAGQNATGAAIAQGTAAATIGGSTSNITVTMTTESIYTGSALGGGLGQITLDHSMNQFTVNDASGAVSGGFTTLPNGDLKLVVAPGSSAPPNDIVYARELQGSVLIFADTGNATVQATGIALSGADMGVGVGLQGCPTTPFTTPVSVADISGPAWDPTVPANSPTYTSGTANITVSGGTATVGFSGNDYSAATSSGSSAVKPQGGSQTCSAGVFSASNQGSVAFSADGFTVVTNGSTGTISLSDVKEGDFGVAQASNPNIATAESGTYDGFFGGIGQSTTSVVKGETPIQVTQISGGMMQACQYSNFEAGTVGTTCYVITIGAATAQTGVFLANVTLPGPTTLYGAVVVGQSSIGKYVIFGNIGGKLVALIQH